MQLDTLIRTTFVKDLVLDCFFLTTKKKSIDIKFQDSHFNVYHFNDLVHT